jgi:hypothetical protein
MKKYRLENMVKGWFVGAFEPTVFNTEAVEVGVKRYQAGDAEGRHHHKVASELTVFLDGRAQMNGVEYGPGDILLISPGESTDFLALTDLTTVVVKLPGARNDKYDGEATC